MLSFHVFTSITFVVWNLSSSHMALNGWQKRERIERVLFLLKIKRSGGLCRRNMRPVAFWIVVVRGFAFMVFFLLLIV